MEFLIKEQQKIRNLAEKDQTIAMIHDILKMVEESNNKIKSQRIKNLTRSRLQ